MRIRAHLATMVAVTLVASCSDPGQVSGSPGDIVEAPRGHPAVRILNAGHTDFDSFSQAAQEADITFSCARGGMPPWQVCLVSEGGILAVVGFDDGAPLLARIRDSGLEEDVLVPLDARPPVGVRNLGPQASLGIEHSGDELVGEMSVPWTPSDG